MGAQLCVYVCVRGCVHDSNMSLQAAAFVLCKPSGAVGSDALSGAVHRGHICLASQALEWLRTLSLRGCARRSSGAAHAVPQGLCTPFVRGCARRSSGAVHAVPQGLCTPFLRGCARRSSGAVHAVPRGLRMAPLFHQPKALGGCPPCQGLCARLQWPCTPTGAVHPGSQWLCTARTLAQAPVKEGGATPATHDCARAHAHTHTLLGTCV